MRATKSLVPVAQVFLCDFGAKVLWGVAGLALIRFLPESEYATLTLALALSGLMVEGVSENLNRIYVIGYSKLGLTGARLSFLTLELGLLALVAPIVCGFSGGTLAPLVVGLAIASSLLAFAKAVLQHELKFWSFSLVELSRTLLFAAALAALIVVERNAVRAWHVLLLQGVCLSVVATVALARTLDEAQLGRPRAALAIGRQIATSGYALMVGYVLLLAVLMRIDVLMLKLLDGPLELAAYGAAFRYHSMLTLLLTAVHSVLLPLTQQARQAEELRSIFTRYRRVVVAVVPAILLGAWLSQWFIPFIDGGKYPSAVNIFRVLCVSSVIGLACSPYVNLLFRYADFAFLLGLCGAILAIDVGLNAVLIPRFHALGAAAALCMAIGTMNLLVYARARTLVASRPLPVLADGTAGREIAR